MNYLIIVSPWQVVGDEVITPRASSLTTSASFVGPIHAHRPRITPRLTNQKG